MIPVEVMTVNAAGYNPSAAVDYASKYWNNYNPSYGNYNNVGGDCANFVSQCLYAGGVEQDGTWYNGSSAWISCSSQIEYFRSKGYTVIDWAQAGDIKIGNPVYYYNGGSMAHTAICVGYDNNGTPLVAAHNSNFWMAEWTLGGANWWGGSTRRVTILISDKHNDNQAPTISNARAENLSSGSFDIKCDLYDDVGVTRVYIIVFSPNGTQNSYNVSAANGSFSHTIYTTDYAGSGEYSVHIYAFDAEGNQDGAAINNIQAIDDTSPPTITGASVINVSGSQFTITCQLDDNVGVNRVYVIVYAPNGTQNAYNVSASNGSFTHTIKTSDYCGAGKYTVHMYAFDAAGNQAGEAIRSIQAIDDTIPPTISEARAIDISGSQFTITCQLDDNVGVNRVYVIVYAPNGTQNAYNVSASNGVFIHTIKTSDYCGEGKYSVHMYAFDAAGNQAGEAIKIIQAMDDTVPPTISEASATDISGSQFTITCQLDDNVGVNRVYVIVYGPNGAQNGYNVYASNGTFTHTIKTSDYDGAGNYSVHLYAFDAAGNQAGEAIKNIQAIDDTIPPTITGASVINVSGSQFTITCQLDDNVNVNRVYIIVYSPDGTQNIGYNVPASNGFFSHTINTSQYGGVGIYKVHLYVFDSSGNQAPCAINDIYAYNHSIADTNFDGIISISDATAIQRYLAELETFTDEQLVLADTNGDGEINIADATWLQMYLAEYDGIVLGKQET